MNDPHKFGTEFGSDHALEHSTPIVSHHDTIKWFEAIPANCAKSFVTREGVERAVKGYVVPKVGLPWPEWIKT